ncbi:MAG: NAD(P)-dependent oxidoreductase, partial [Gammaproteobacteria bacterium]
MKIAVLGTGLMGAPMAMRLLEAEHDVWVWNRDPSRAEPLRAGGAEVCETPVEAIAEAEFVITMLSDARAIVEVAFSPEARGVLRDRTLIQMATIDPQESRELAEAMQQAGGDYLEAPVLGSIPEATRGELIIMAGGEETVFQRCLPVLKALGPEPRLIGAVGQGAALKLAMNQLIAGLTTSFSLSLALVRHEGVDVDDFMEILRGSALYAPTFDKKLPRMLEGDYERPNFPLKHLDKDT